MKRALLFVLLIVGAAPSAPRCEQPQWTHYNNRDEIRAIYRQGNSLWLGTNGGLLIYDLSGDEIREQHLLGDNLPSSSIRAIAGMDKTIYIGSDGGLTIFEDGKYRPYPSQGAASLRNVQSIDFGYNGDVCIGTYGGGAGIIHQEKLSMVTRADSLLDDRVYAVIQLSDAACYYATSYGVCSFKDSLWENYRVGAGLAKGEALDLIVAEDLGMYALISGGGVFHFDGSRGRRLSTDGLFLDHEIAAIAVEKDQTVWAAGRFGGIKKYRRGSWHYVGDGTDEDVRRTRWTSAYAYPLGRVYFGGRNGLVVSIYHDEIRKLTVPSSLPSNHIHHMVEDSTGRRYIAAGSDLLFIPPDGSDYVKESVEGPVTAMVVSPQGEFHCGTRWGVFRKIGERFEEIPVDHGGKIAIVTAMVFDRQGHLWLGTDQGEVLKQDGSLWIRLGEMDELTGGEVTAIVQDDFGSMWVLSAGTGAARFAGHEWKRYPIESFGGQAPAAIIIGKEGRPIIAGTETLWQYQGNDTWNPLPLADPSSNTSFTSLCSDRSGRIYAGTAEGLLLVNGKSSRYIRPGSGLAGKNVSSLLVDRTGILWVGFQKDGISCVRADHLW